MSTRDAKPLWEHLVDRRVSVKYFEVTDDMADGRSNRPACREIFFVCCNLTWGWRECITDRGLLFQRRRQESWSIRK